MQPKSLRIGTRGSPLALWQANEVRRQLIAHNGLPESAVAIEVIKTSGDRIQDRALADIGGKGLFTKEIEEALIERRIDLAVHSMKDVETKLPDGLVIAAMLERADVRDAFISLTHKSLDALPRGAVVGTSSLRRQAQVRRLRPDVQVVGFRGNVETRLRKLQDGAVEATFLACAGLIRLGEAARITQAIETSQMLPAIAQGAVGVEIRADDEITSSAVAKLDHAATRLCVTAERAFLAHLDGSCRTPIAGLARIDAGRLVLAGELLETDGSAAWCARAEGTPAEALVIAEAVAKQILAQKANAGTGSHSGGA